MGLVFLALRWLPSFSSPRAGAVSGRSFEPIRGHPAIHRAQLALHARQVDVKLRLDTSGRPRQKETLCFLWGVVVIRGSLGRDFRWGAPGWTPVATWASLLGGGGCGGGQGARWQEGRRGQPDEPCLMVRDWLLC